jgi:hypothetical protein
VSHGHGRRESAEDVSEPAGLAPRRHLGADEDDVHAAGGGVAHDVGGEPAPARALRPPRLPGRAGPHGQRVRRRGRPSRRRQEAATAERGPVGGGEAGARGGDQVARREGRHVERGEVRSCGPVHRVQIQQDREKLGSPVRVKTREKVL